MTTLVMDRLKTMRLCRLADHLRQQSGLWADVLSAKLGWAFLQRLAVVIVLIELQLGTGSTVTACQLPSRTFELLFNGPIKTNGGI